MTDEQKILLLDSNSLINRAFYALPPMQTKDGLFTNAIYGYLSMLNKLLNEEKPTHVCAVFDCHAKTFRHQKYEAYKAGRKPMPPELVMQVPVLQELLQKMGIKLLFKEGIEADDIIGTLAKRFSVPTVIVSGDRDVLQLVDDTTTVFHTKRGVTDIKKYTPAALYEEGFSPRQIIEYKALAGDSSDNIPGCPGVGDKTARDLLATFGDVDAIFSRLDEVKGKLKEKLSENKDSVYMSRDLATIEINADIPCALEEIAFSPVLPHEAEEMMTKLEFKNLTSRFSFDQTETKPERKAYETETAVFEDVQSAANALNDIPKGEKVCIEWGQDVVIAFGNKEYVFKIAEGLLADGITEGEAVNLLAPFYTSEYTNIFFDAKKSFYYLENIGVKPEKPYEDVLLEGYLINNTKVIRDEKSLLEDYGYDGEHVASDLLRLHSELCRTLEEKQLQKLYYEIELPLTKCLFDMEKAGFLIDTDILEELNETFSNEIEILARKIHEIAGDENFNINSNKQLASVLFDKLGLKTGKKNKTGYSVSSDVLEELEHPIIDALLRYRQLTKLKSTYIDGMKQVMNPATKKVHTDFKQCLTSTGRLSSSEPNLQNIPVRTAEGREIRKMFVPGKGNVLISADYSQIELRLLAHCSQEPRLLEAYKNGTDIHTLTASMIFGKQPEEVTPDMRRSAKAVNFGIIYGISGFGLAKNAGVSNKKAKEFIDGYFAMYPKVKEYMDKNVALAKKQGYLRSMLGRIRYFPELASPQYTVRSFGERAAMNFPLQGSASDIIKIAMLRVHKTLADKKLKAKMILQVHDELIVECPADEEEEVKFILRECMQNAMDLTVPLEIGVASGENWYDAK